MEWKLWDFNPGERTLAELSGIELKYRGVGCFMAWPLGLLGIRPVVSDVNIFLPLKKRRDIHIFNDCIVVGDNSCRVDLEQSWEARYVLGRTGYDDYSKPM